MNYKEFCLIHYQELFDSIYNSLPLKMNDKDKRINAQKRAIRESSINAIKKFPDIEPALIWKTIYVAHIHNVSKVSDLNTIVSVIAADNSWKKSSGHAFEEMIKELGNLSLLDYGIEIILQKDLSNLLKVNKILNEVRDLSWLREQIKASVFDLYLVIKEEDGYTVFGCIQSKTSIRDRVTRDREPSINAMAAYFLSVAIVLDGAFLKLPKFISMVNGNSSSYDRNGWHAMYVLSNEEKTLDRIFSIDIAMNKFVEDVIKAAHFWKTQRQWFDHSWHPDANSI